CFIFAVTLLSGSLPPPVFRGGVGRGFGGMCFQTSEMSRAAGWKAAQIVRTIPAMSLRVYNTLSKQKELFAPVEPGRVRMYLCGPTVYKPPHMGHMVGPIIFDAVKRYLVYKGFGVTWVVNITDVDDKLIESAKEEKTSVEALAARYTKDYFDCLALLGIDTIDH